MAESKLDEIIRTRQFPGVRGLSDGRGSGNNELIFDRPDTAKEMRIAFQRMESDGKFDGHPERADAAKQLLKDAESKIRVDIDYQKGWHPLDRNPHTKVEQE